MLYWQRSPTHIYFLSEYWVFIPIMLVTDSFIIVKIISHKRKKKKLRELKEKIERLRKIRRVMVMTNLTLSGIMVGAILNNRGGSDFCSEFYDIDFDSLIDVDDPDCKIKPNLNYLDHKGLRDMILTRFKYKAKNKLIFITATALCHLAKSSGNHLLSTGPFELLAHVGLTNVYQAGRKLAVTVFLGSVPIVYYGCNAFVLAFILGTVGLRLAFSDLDEIDMSFINPNIAAKDLKPRIPGIGDVVIVNRRHQIVMGKHIKPKQPYECWLPGQTYLNPKCDLQSIQIPDAVIDDLGYDDVVNMRDVTTLKKDFTDILDMGQKATTSLPSTKPKARSVNFLKLFYTSNSENIPEAETWETSGVSNQVSKIPENKIGK